MDSIYSDKWSIHVLKFSLDIRLHKVEGAWSNDPMGIVGRREDRVAQWNIKNEGESELYQGIFSTSFLLIFSMYYVVQVLM